MTQRIGASWHDSMESAVLRVPSSVESSEFNFVINTDHPGFSRITFRTPEPYLFDPRLKN